MKFETFNYKINKDGFVILKKLIKSNQVNEILDGFEETLDYCISLISKNKKFKNLSEKFMWLQKYNNNLKGRAYDISRYHPSLSKIVTNKKILLFMKKYFKRNPLVDQPSIKIEDYLNKRLLPLHQDYYGILSSKSLTLWLALTNVSKHNGTMKFIKGSHKKGPLKHKFYKKKNFIAHGILEKFVKSSKVEYVNIKSGDAVIFHPLLIHGSSQNKSKKVRINYIARFADIRGIDYINKSKSKTMRIPLKT